MLSQSVERVHFLKLRRRARLARQSEGIHFLKNFGAFSFELTANPLRLQVIRRTGQNANVDPCPARRGAGLDRSFGLLSVTGVMFVVVDNRIGLSGVFQSRERNTLNSRPE